MVGGILPILVQWLALSQIGNILIQQSSYIQSTFPPKSQWTLLQDINSMPEDDIEKFLPQVCNLLIDRDTMNDLRLVDHLESILVDKCSKCLPFGFRVCSLLKVRVAFYNFTDLKLNNIYLGCFTTS